MPSTELEGKKNAFIEVITDSYVRGSLDMPAFESAVGRITASSDEASLAVEAASLGLSLPAVIKAATEVEGESVDLDCVSGNIRKEGDWLRSGRYRLRLRSSSVRLDFRHYAYGPSFRLELDLLSVSSTIRLIVPRGFQIEDRIDERQSSVVKNRPKVIDREGSVIQLRGSLRSSVIKVTYK